MSSSAENRSEKPTRRKLEKAREKGQIARSKEVPSAAVLFGGLIVLVCFGQAVLRTLEFEMLHTFNFRLPPDLTIPYLSGSFNDIGMRIAAVLVPVLLAVLVFSIVANVLQGGL